MCSEKGTSAQWMSCDAARWPSAFAYAFRPVETHELRLVLKVGFRRRFGSGLKDTSSKELHSLAGAVVEKKTWQVEVITWTENETLVQFVELLGMMVSCISVAEPSRQPLAPSLMEVVPPLVRTQPASVYRPAEELDTIW